MSKHNTFKETLNKSVKRVSPCFTREIKTQTRAQSESWHGGPLRRPARPPALHQLIFISRGARPILIVNAKPRASFLSWQPYQMNFFTWKVLNARNPTTRCFFLYDCFQNYLPLVQLVFFVHNIWCKNVRNDFVTVTNTSEVSNYASHLQTTILFL